MIAEEYGYWMKDVLGFDLLFNVLTGGDVGVFFSTRAYVNAKSDKRKGWLLIRCFGKSIVMIVTSGKCHASSSGWIR